MTRRKLQQNQRLNASTLQLCDLRTRRSRNQGHEGQPTFKMWWCPSRGIKALPHLDQQSSKQHRRQPHVVTKADISVLSDKHVLRARVVQRFL